MVSRFLKEFDAACLEKEYDNSTRLGIYETIRFIQSVGYLSNHRKLEPTAPLVSVIEEQCFSDLWQFLTANCSKDSTPEAGQLPPDAKVHDIKVFLCAVMGCRNFPWMKNKQTSVVDGPLSETYLSGE